MIEWLLEEQIVGFCSGNSGAKSPSGLGHSSDSMAARDEAAKTSTLLVQLGWSFPKLGVSNGDVFRTLFL